MNADYRESHLGEHRARSYLNTYSRGYYAAQWEAIEGPLLRRLFAAARDEGVRSLLDFAAGTGRITSVARDYFDEVTAVDISPDMLAQIAPAANVTTICQDITARPLKRTFDACTAFRFFLNAEPALRDSALTEICNVLEPGGLLIANIHMLSSSPMGWAYRALRRLGAPAHKVMSIGDFRSLLAAHGFKVRKEISYGFLPRPGPLFPSAVERLAGPADRVASRLHLPGSLAQSCLFIAEKL